MEREFVTIEQAKELFELEYDLPAVKRYFHLNGKFADDFDAPLKQQVFRWFRDKYDLFYDIYPIFITASDKSGSRYKWDVYNYSFIESDLQIIGYLTYEEAENACIDKLIEIAKQQDK